MAGLVRDFRDLLAWQKSAELALAVERLCVRLPPAASSLATQLRRSSQSIAANIAEGNGRFSRADYVRHLSMAHGSLKETESHLLLVQRLYLDDADLLPVMQLATTVGRLIGGLRRSLQNTRKPG